MNYLYYVVDDLRQKSWKQQKTIHSTLKVALMHYQMIPDTAVKSIGIVSDDGGESLEIARCLQLYSWDIAGQPVLPMDAFYPDRWRVDEKAMKIVRKVIAELNVRMCLDGRTIVPKPECGELSEELADKTLICAKGDGPESAISCAYLGGEHWTSYRAVERRFPMDDRMQTYPLVLKYRVWAVDAKGKKCFLEVTPWEFRMLAERTLMRDTKDKRGGKQNEASKDPDPCTHED